METVHSPQAPNDKQELVPTVAAIAAEAGPVTTVLADNGLYSETAVQQVEQITEGSPTRTTVLAAMDKASPHRSVADLEKKPEPADT